MKFPKFTKVKLDERNRMLRAGAGLHDGNWFVRIDLWWFGLRISKRVKPLCDLDNALRKAIVAAQDALDQRTIAEFESILKDDVSAYSRPGEVIYTVTLKEIIQFAKMTRFGEPMQERINEVKSELSAENKAMLAKFESCLESRKAAYTSFGEVTYEVKLDELLKFFEQIKAPVNQLCTGLEKLPRVLIKDGQTFAKVDYEEIDAMLYETRTALGITHQPVPHKKDAPLHALLLLSTLQQLHAAAAKSNV